MKIGVLGTGVVGQTLGRAFIAEGNDVMMGARSAGNDKAVAWAKEAGAHASEGSFADAAKFGELIVLATLGVANEEALTMAGADNLRGKVLIDTTNPLGGHGFPPTLAVSGNDSGGERVQRHVPDAKVVKAFNTVGNAAMYKPSFPGGPPDMFIAGNDAAAKGKVTEILTDFGWQTTDLGGIECSRYLEAMCIAWVLACAKSGDWVRAFKLLSKK